MDIDERLHKATHLGDRPRSQYGTHRESGDAHLETEATGLAFADSDPCERWVGEDAEGD